jgi:hypothetical protein
VIGAVDETAAKHPLELLGGKASTGTTSVAKHPLWQRFNLFGVFVKFHDVVGLLLCNEQGQFVISSSIEGI